MIVCQYDEALHAMKKTGLALLLVLAAILSAA